MKSITKSFFSTKEKEVGKFSFFWLQTVVEIWEKEVGSVKILR
jgi:hypothetical protein